MRLIWYEFVKLRQKRLFWALAAVLLAGNLLLLYTLEKNTAEFFYVHEQREAYQAFQAGDSSVDASGWYQFNADAQAAYIQSYGTFLGEMEARADQMSQTAIFAEQNSFVYRNLFQTCTDFAHLSGLELKPDNGFGLSIFAGYNSGTLFLLAFLAILTYFVIFYERDMGLTLLLKGNRLGHAPLALSKFAVMLCAAMAYTLLQEGSTILFLGWMYGYGDLSRPIQSVSLFRNCAHFLSVGQGLAVMLLIRVAVAVLFACVLFCIGMCVKHEALAALVTAAGLGGEYLLRMGFSTGGILNWLKCVNLFYCWDMKGVLGEYLNLNLFGWPVNKEFCTIAVTAGIALLLPSAGVLVFSKTGQIKASGYWERVMQWFRGKLSVLGRRTSLLYYEFYKMMFQQKKGIVFVLLLVWCAYEITGVFGPTYYAEPEAAAYRYYIERLSGPVTEDTIAFMTEEENRLDGLRQEMMQLTGGQASDYVKLLSIQSELERFEGGFYAVQQQLEALTGKPGALEQKYLMDERSYVSLWQDTQRDISLWFAGSVLLLFFICGIHTADEKNHMRPLLHATQKGQRELERSKTVCALLCALALFVTTELPLFLRYYKIDRFSTAGQHLSDFTQAIFASDLPLWMLLLGVFGLKILSFLFVCLGGIKLSNVTKNETVAVLIGVGAVGAIAIVLYRLDLDANRMLIRLLQ